MTLSEQVAKLEDRVKELTKDSDEIREIGERMAVNVMEFLNKEDKDFSLYCDGFWDKVSKGDWSNEDRQLFQKVVDIIVKGV